MEALAGRTAIVTGGGAGIGRAICLALAQSGVRVAVCDLDRQRAEGVAEEVTGLGATCRAYRLDVASHGEAVKVAEQVAADLGNIAILVNNAGITRDSLLLRMSEQDFDLVLGVNLKGAFNMTKACLRYMLKERWGRIVNIASVVGEMGNAGQANYVAAKAGLIGLTKVAAREVASRGVTVNAIAPGFITTAMTSSLPEEVKENYRRNIPLGRFGTPEDVAKVCMFLVSDQADYVTGQVIRVDGGLLMA